MINCKKCSDCKIKEPLFILDDKIITKKKFKEIDPKKIKSTNVYKHKKATFMYGTKGENGVIVITTKSKKELRKEKRRVNRKNKK